MSSSLYWSNPENVVACFGVEEGFGSLDGFFHGFCGVIFCYFPACGDVQYGGYVAAYALLIFHDFRLACFHAAVNENLVCSRIGHNYTVEIQETV